MLAVAQRFVGNEEAARDCVQKAFLQAFRGIDRFEERASLGTWLHRIVVNAALTKLRARDRRPEESLEALLPQFDGHGGRIEPEAGWSVSIETLLEDRERRAAFNEEPDAPVPEDVPEDLVKAILALRGR